MPLENKWHNLRTSRGTRRSFVWIWVMFPTSHRVKAILSFKARNHTFKCLLNLSPHLGKVLSQHTNHLQNMLAEANSTSRTKTLYIPSLWLVRKQEIYYHLGRNTKTIVWRGKKHLSSTSTLFPDTLLVMLCFVSVFGNRVLQMIPNLQLAVKITILNASCTKLKYKHIWISHEM